jgi:acyl-CoA dehydrogenase
MAIVELRDLSQEERLIKQTIEEIGRDYGHDYWLECVQEDRFPQEAWEIVKDNGWTGVTIPEEYGGVDMDLTTMRFMIEESAAQFVPLPFLITNATMTAIPLKRHGDEDLKERFLPRIASGEARFCFALTEADAGTNAMRMQTQANREGDEYVINGEKSYISQVAEADYMQLVLRTTPHEDVDAKTEGMTILLVDTEADGIEYSPMDIAIPDTSTYTVHFDDVRVPVENRVGEAGQGFIYLLDSLNTERIVVPAEVIGRGRFALERGVEYAKEREVFGEEAIGSYQGIQHPFAEAKTLLEHARFGNERAAEAVETGDEDAGMYANMSNYFASQAAETAVDAAVQAHGGRGFDRNYGVINVERFIRFSRVGPLNDEMALNFIGENALGLPSSYL